MQSETTPRLTDEPGIRFGYALALLGLTLLVAGGLPLGEMATQALVVLVMGVFSACLPWAVRPVVGLVSWAFFTGFVVNAYGQLTFAPADDRRLLVFVGAVVGVAALSRALVPAREPS